MDTSLLMDGGLPATLASRYLPEKRTASGPAGLFAVRDAATGSRYWLQYLGADTPARAGLATAAELLAQGKHSHLAQLSSASLDGEAPYLLLAWQAETPWQSSLKLDNALLALQLLETVSALQTWAAPVALPALAAEQLLVLPLSGYLRLADVSGAVVKAGEAELQAGRQACVAVLGKLLGEAAGGLLDSNGDWLPGAWQNEGAGRYAALAGALQRLHLTDMMADL